MSFCTADYVFLGIIIFFTIISTIRGFVSELFKKASWLLGIICGCIFCENVGNLFLKNVISNGFVRIILGFLIVFIIVFLIFKLLEIIFSRLVDNAILGSLNRALGVILGIGEGIAVVCLIIIFVKSQPFFEVEWLDKSFFAKFLG